MAQAEEKLQALEEAVKILKAHIKYYDSVIKDSGQRRAATVRDLLRATGKLREAKSSRPRRRR